MPGKSIPFAEAFSLKTARVNGQSRPTRMELIHIDGHDYPCMINEFWTARQRQAASLHEISYRACFKPQLPRFFIQRFSKPGDRVYDPFSGRGTTALEAALQERCVVANDVNPLSTLLTRPRLFVPDIAALEERLAEISWNPRCRAAIDLSMFYHPRTEGHLVSLKRYLIQRQAAGSADAVDDWIRMVATNRLTGHSPGFFSVYTLPPNQATSAERQVIINRRRGQRPAPRDVPALILKKSRRLIAGIDGAQKMRLGEIGRHALFMNRDARHTPEIGDNSVQLTVTSPPFLNVVQYASDNWLRCWFNNIDAVAVGRSMTNVASLHKWEAVMGDVFRELWRITVPGGWVAFEVGEVRNGALRLEEHATPLGTAAGFRCRAIMINDQRFTKTANIWGINNNTRGTNSNRIIIFQKPARS